MRISVIICLLLTISLSGPPALSQSKPAPQSLWRTVPLASREYRVFADLQSLPRLRAAITPNDMRPGTTFNRADFAIVSRRALSVTGLPVSALGTTRQTTRSKSVPLRLQREIKWLCQQYRSEIAFFEADSSHPAAKVSRSGRSQTNR